MALKASHGLASRKQTTDNEMDRGVLDFANSAEIPILLLMTTGIFGIFRTIESLVMKDYPPLNSVADLWNEINRLCSTCSDSWAVSDVQSDLDTSWDGEQQSCYAAWRCLRILTQVALDSRNSRQIESCFDLVERCEQTDMPRIIREPSFVCFWEDISFDGPHHEHVAIVENLPNHCRSAYLREHPALKM